MSGSAGTCPAHEVVVDDSGGHMISPEEMLDILVGLVGGR